MGIEPILSAWKAEVLAIIRMAQISALDSLSAINKYGDNKEDCCLCRYTIIHCMPLRASEIRS